MYISLNYIPLLHFYNLVIPGMVLLLSIALTHAFGALATNYSMALIPAASTHVLKVLEPMITGGIAWLTIGISENTSVTRVLAVVLVVIGAVGATNHNPSNAGHPSFFLPDWTTCAASSTL